MDKLVSRWAYMGLYCRERRTPGRLLAKKPSEIAKRCLKVIQWYRGHGEQVRLTARHFGFSPDTISRWAAAYAVEGIHGLESKSPRKVRQPRTPSAREGNSHKKNLTWSPYT